MRRINRYFWVLTILVFQLVWPATSSPSKPQTKAAEPTRRALLIGINTYLPATNTPDTTAAKRGRNRGLWANLDGPVNDVDALHELLVARFGFKEENIRVLKEAEATRANILKAMQEQLIDAPAPGDPVLFFYAGHGSQVFNSKSPETDKRDESIVPADSFQGAPDIRDKELNQRFNEALAKGVQLTAIFDSCHSGSIQRGSYPAEEKQRALEPNMEDANDPWKPEKLPEQRGALILSATRDDQLAVEKKDDNGVAHGIFTRALLKTLQTVPVNEPAERVYLRVKALMQLESSVQEPVLAPANSSTYRTLLGGEAAALSGLTTVAALKTLDNGFVELQGGRAVGLVKDCELKSLENTANPIRLRITENIGLNRSRAEVISASAAVPPGMLFEVEHWFAPDEATLSVWLPPAQLTKAQLQQTAQALTPLQTSDKVRWIDDPTEFTEPQPFYEIAWNGTEWTLSLSGKPIKKLGLNPTAEAVLEALPPRTKSALLLRLPPPAELKLQFGADAANSQLKTSATPARADYVLTGRLHEGQIKYAWTRPNLTRLQGARLPLPARTDWFSSELPQLSRKLEELILRCSKIKAWLQLEAPPERRPFPYRLALKQHATGERKMAGTTIEKEKYDLILQAEREQLLLGAIKPRYVYVFVIDNAGDCTLLYPEATAGNVENRFPIEVAGQQKAEYPAEISLKENALEIVPPFGLDTFILITSVDPIPNYADAFHFEGVRRGTEGQTRGKTTPLERLLYGTGAATRGAREVVPAEWSIQRISLKSEPLTQSQPKPKVSQKRFLNEQRRSRNHSTMVKRFGNWK